MIEVVWDRRVLARAEVARNLSTNCWEAVKVAVGDGGRVSVSHGGVEYLSGITLPQWPVGAHWAFGLSAGAIGGQYASANRALQFDNLRLRTPLLAPRHAAPLAISFNGQQYTSPLHFSYYRPPVLSAALPASGPTAGGTLVLVGASGLAEGTHRLCRFAGTIDVPANLTDPVDHLEPAEAEAVAVGEHLRCLSPPANGSTAGC